MRSFKLIGFFLACCLIVVFLSFDARAEEQLPNPETYLYDHPDKTGKKLYDDPTDLFVTRPFKDILPPALYGKITADQEKMKKDSAELLGFTAPELVGKIAPEIKPGKYTYNDLEQSPGLRELIPQELQRFFKKGGPPLTGNIEEFEIVPTQQFHINRPCIEATKRNMEKTKLDKDGYIVKRSWEGGIPFPRPSGEFKAQQVFYNFFLRSNAFNMCWAITVEANSFDSNLKLDRSGIADVAKISWKARTLFPPYGWFDERADKNNEWCSYSYIVSEPRSQRGTILLRMLYDDPEKMDAAMVYVPSLRRIRKLSATDTQDPTGDLTYDDQNMLLQKISPHRYPYKYEIIAEREYLLPCAYGSGLAWCDSKNGYSLKGVIFMRRPTYVLQMNQMDPNYVYSKRIYYIDKENFDCGLSDMYDQKGRLYRTQIYLSFVFVPEGGWMINYGGYVFQRDYADLHSSLSMPHVYPAPWPRDRFNMYGLLKKAK